MKSTYSGNGLLQVFQTYMKLLLYHRHQPEVVSDSICHVLQRMTNLSEAYQMFTNVISDDVISNDIYCTILYGQLEYVQWKLEQRNVVVSTNKMQRKAMSWNDDDSEVSDEEDKCMHPKVRNIT